MLAPYCRQYLVSSTSRCAKLSSPPRPASGLLDHTTDLRRLSLSATKHQAAKPWKHGSERGTTAFQRPKLPPARRLKPSYGSELLAFRYAAESDKAFEVIKQYPDLLRGGILEPRDSTAIFRSLHYGIRASDRDKPTLALRQLCREVFPRALSEFRRGLLPAHKVALIHILATFRDLEDYKGGIDFWNWVLSHPQEHQSPSLATYGVAIELLAQSDNGLELCEELFKRGLEANKSDFNDYLLSPGSVLSKPHLPLDSKGVSLVFLQGITHARLMHGDWKGAYRGLDTALKLLPDQLNSRFLETFVDQRPLFESLEILRIFLRSGSKVTRPITLRLLQQLDQIRAESRDRHVELGNRAGKELLRVFQHALASGQNLDDVCLSLLVRSALLALPPMRGFKGSEKAEASGLASQMISRIFDLSQRFSLLPGQETWYAVYQMAIKQRDFKLARDAFTAMFNMGYGLPSNQILELIDTASQDEATEASSILRTACQSRYIGANEKFWQTLASTAVRLGNPRLFNEILEAQSLYLPTHIIASAAKMIPIALREDAWRELSKPEEGSTPLENEAAHEPPDFSAARDIISLTNEAIDALNSGQSHLFETELRAPFYLGSYEADYPESWYKSLYSDLHLKPIDAAADGVTDLSKKKKTTQSSLTKTGFPYAALRYANWRDMTALMLKAKAFMESDADKSCLALHDAKRRKTRGTMIIGIVAEQQVQNYTSGMQVQKAALDNEQSWRAAVLDLRGEYLT